MTIQEQIENMKRNIKAVSANADKEFEENQASGDWMDLIDLRQQMYQELGRWEYMKWFYEIQ